MPEQHEIIAIDKLPFGSILSGTGTILVTNNGVTQKFTVEQFRTLVNESLVTELNTLQSTVNSLNSQVNEILNGGIS